MTSSVYFVENLTLRAWGISIWPRLLMRLLSGNRVACCYLFDGSAPAMLIARTSGLLTGTGVRRLDFRSTDVRDEDGLGARLRVRYQVLADAQQRAIALPAFQDLHDTGVLHDRLQMFLAKNIVEIRPATRNIVWRALNLVTICLWTMKRDGNYSGSPVLFLERLPWLSVVTHYGTESGVSIIPVAPALGLVAYLRSRVPPQVEDLARLIRYRQFPRMPSYFKRQVLSAAIWSSRGKHESSGEFAWQRTQTLKPLVAIDYYGQFNLDRPECHSDLFFWQCSSLKGSDLLLTFGNRWDPLDAAKWAQLQEHGMSAVALHPGATTIPGALVFEGRVNVKGATRFPFSIRRNGLEKAWINTQISRYDSLRDYWTHFFDQYNIKVYLSWYKYDGLHYAVADALQSLGGVTAIYQRAYESNPSTEFAIGVDIGFGFSQGTAEVERQSKSCIRYHVTTGYLGDHRYSLLRESARSQGQALRDQGAKHVLAFFDENTVDEHRFGFGHHGTQENYQFLLEKVLAEPWLGLLIKPKTPKTLRRRLGPVGPLLERAEATGRCYVYEDGPTQGSDPPAKAALAADIAIHGHLHAASAGIDAALAGVPTLMLDREGWSMSPLYRLGVGRVVFTDWEPLWEACRQHWSTPGGVPGFGDWSHMLDELDPFRDGRAAERMGTYVQWLIEGFQAGLNRETVMADAAERYCASWGIDKVTQVTGKLCA